MLRAWSFIVKYRWVLECAPQNPHISNPWDAYTTPYILSPAYILINSFLRKKLFFVPTLEFMILLRFPIPPSWQTTGVFILSLLYDLISVFAVAQIEETLILSGWALRISTFEQWIYGHHRLWLIPFPPLAFSLVGHFLVSSLVTRRYNHHKQTSVLWKPSNSGVKEASSDDVRNMPVKRLYSALSRHPELHLVF